MLFLAVLMDFVLQSCLDQNLIDSWNHPFTIKDPQAVYVLRLDHAVYIVTTNFKNS
jgi:hypothetical protein